MKQFLLTALACLSWFTVTAQSFFVETKQLPIRHYNTLEKRLHSVRLPDKHITVLGADFTLGPTQQYSRTNTSVRPRPVVSYTYSLPDSVVRSIEVEIDSLNYLGNSYAITHGYREPQTRYPYFLSAYNRLKQEMGVRLGKPAGDEPAHKVTSNLSEVYEASTRWETTELRADIFLVFTIATKAPDQNSSGYSMSASNTYRIRANIRYKNPTKPNSSLADAKASNPKQVAIAEQYIGLLLKGKLTESWQLLGPDITQAITFEQYKSSFTNFLATLTNPEKGASLFMSGPSFSNNGQMYATYSFKLNSDTTSPPSTIIIVIFKDFQTELISGVQPRSRPITIPITK